MSNEIGGKLYSTQLRSVIHTAAAIAHPEHLFPTSKHPYRSRIGDHTQYALSYLPLKLVARSTLINESFISAVINEAVSVADYIRRIFCSRSYCARGNVFLNVSLREIASKSNKKYFRDTPRQNQWTARTNSKRIENEQDGRA